jgi:hypothetical protein
MYHNSRKKRRTDEPRLVHLTNGRGILLHRTSSNVMGMCGPVDQWQTIAHLTHYRFYVLTADGAGRVHLTRKVREARS